jgi:hypothetical protein
MERGSATRSNVASEKRFQDNASALKFERCCGSQSRAPTAAAGIRCGYGFN